MDIVLSQIPSEAYQILCAAGLGLLLGSERAFKRKAASIRTFALLSAGSALFTILSVMAGGGSTTVDTSRIAAQIVSGLGFLGAGVIFRYENKLTGVTTAVMIWFAAAIGMACGFNKIPLAASSVAIYYLILIVGEGIHRISRTKRDLDEDDD
ncbi:MAG: hypothetical protein DRQ40_00520 [Gammaproteobacteria bacterium]|nr:MAG: hypothetical protein DRQ40_00520 [Gammaproteobacteria bacterium]RLB68316.1 MAG: hypothetical protein DRH08_01290 [Deltaproteobacteria bacterium]